MQERRPFIVGLTGGIGSGKTAAADIFANLGAQVIDTDQIAHALTASDGPAMPAIQASFGAEVLTADGALDRSVMRQRVFADPGERKRLEAILHPLIRAECEARICRLASPEKGIPFGHADFSKYVILVVPLLIESGSWRERVDRVAVVDCPEETQITRVMQRGKLTRDEVVAILAAQASRPARLAFADDVISNDDGLDALHETVKRLHERYLDLARQTGISRSA